MHLRRYRCARLFAASPQNLPLATIAVRPAWLWQISESGHSERKQNVCFGKHLLCKTDEAIGPLFKPID
jgi:hypothetical protein